MKKQCKKCNELKPMDAYSRKPEARDGKSPVCKDCNNRRDKERREQRKAERFEFF
jgi:hypothetical protein